MGTTLHTLKGPKGATRDRKRLGRGPGSGTGKTVGQGRQGPEGAQRPPRRPPRLRGRSDADAASLPEEAASRTPSGRRSSRSTSALSRSGSSSGVVDLAALQNAGIVPAASRTVKILGEGDLTKKLTVKAHVLLGVGQGEDRSGGRHGRGRRDAGARGPRRVVSERHNGVRLPEHRQDSRAAPAHPLHADAARGLPRRRVRHDPGCEPADAWPRS